MQKALITTFIALLILVSGSVAQETYFGKNKVRYRDFDWQYIQTRHFDIYFYENGYPISKFAADVLESAYDEISAELNYKIQNRVPIFIYNSHIELQQTNIIPVIISEGIGGVTESFKNRVVVPFTGSYEDLRHVLHHELTHAVLNDMLFGGSIASMLYRQRMFNMPLWFSEGYAEYSSNHGWDYNSDMFLRDATINGYLIPPDYLYGYLAYRQGQAMIKYIADKYGEDKINLIIQKGRVHVMIDQTLEAAIGVNQEDFWKEFQKEMKRRYWPDITTRKEADEIGKQLTEAREDGSYFNEKPAYAPDGDRVAIFTDKSDFTEIVLISPYDGKLIRRLVKAERSGDLESLHAYVSGMSWSPTGEAIVFAAKTDGQEALLFVDTKNGNVYRKHITEYQNILNPSWSPDGKKIAFAALSGHKRDIYVLDIESGETEQITDNRYDDIDPDWLANSRELIFSSDMPHPQSPVIDGGGHPYVIEEAAFMPGDLEYGNYNLFRVSTSTKRIEAIDVGPGQNTMPQVSPDGNKLAFISNRNGIDNIYVAHLENLDYYAVTDILTGVRHISWSPDSDRIAFSAYYQGAFDIFVLEKIVPVGEGGTLSPTAFVRGDYDLLNPLAEDSVQADAELYAQLINEAEQAHSDGPGNDSGSSEVDTVETVDETGIYEDEFVYVGDEKDFSLDSVLTDIPGQGSTRTAPPEEPAAFDSIPNRLASGEYQIKHYRSKLTTDYVGGGFAYDTFFGLRGQTYFLFSDHLGNHQIFIATSLVNSLDQSFIQAFYFNNKNRINYGVGAFHTKNFYEDSYGFLFSDRFYGGQFFASRPNSVFSRIEAGVSQVFIDRKYLDLIDPRDNRSSRVSSANLSYVFDNVLWGYTGPVNGRRIKFTVDGGINLFDNGDVNFYSVGMDYRKYWHFNKTFSMAFRVSGGASFGETPKRYFLGGTTNWIGSRTVDAQVYDVENLYFADVVTPLRSEDYYGMSGNRYGLVNWEFRFPMIQYFAMRYPLPIVISNVTGAVFTDIGAAWFGHDFKGGITSDGPARLNDIKTGFGIGMRVNLFGFALLRYDAAWSTDMVKVSERPTHYFSFGADF